MKLTLTIFLVFISILSYGQGCTIATSNLTELSGDDGSGNCTYSLDILFTEGSGPDNGTLTFSATNATLLTGGGPHSCACTGNTYTITFEAVCGTSISITAFHNNSGGGNDCTITETGIALPVKWLDLEVTNYFDKRIALYWSTASEINNDRFEIENSSDGINFISIGTVPGSGTSYGINEYAFSHFEPIKGTSYYRIKQVDYDNNYSYSKIVVVKIFDDSAIRVFPNPASDNLNITSDSNDFNVSIIDQNGQLMATSTCDYIDISMLPAGIYIVKVKTDRDTFVQRIIKSD